jgi:hypothetical protein
MTPNQQFAKLRERLSVNKREQQQFVKEKCHLVNLYELDDREEFHFKISKLFPDLCNLGYSGDNNMVAGHNKTMLQSQLKWV